MKPKKLLVAILVGSLTLVACNNGSPKIGSAAQVNQTKSTQAAAEGGGKFLQYVTTGLMGFTNPFSIPGKWFDAFVTSYLLPQDDKVYKKLEQMDKKLDSIIDSLKNSIQISSTTLDTLNKFYNDQMLVNLQQSLGKMDKDIVNVTSKFTAYSSQQVFGDASTDKIDELYNVAASQCTNPAIFGALDSPKNPQGKIGLQSVDIGHVDDMYSQFKTDYAATNYDGGSVYEQLAGNKSRYLGTIFNSMQVGDDLMNYINYYNYTNIRYATRLLGAFQDLYTMQVAQLAYNYACNANIEMSNVKLPVVKQGDGLVQFKAALVSLNNTYDTTYKQLEANITKYLKPIDNKELYSFVNSYVMSSGAPLLSDKSFNTNESAPGSCSLTHLRVSSSKAENGVNAGVGKLVASCVTANGVNGLEDMPIALEIPYTMTGNTIYGIGMSDIGFDPQTQKMQVKINNSVINASTLRNIVAPRDFSENDMFEALGASSFRYAKTGNNTYSWARGPIDTGDGVDLFNIRTTWGYDEMGGDLKYIMPDKDDVTIDGETINYLRPRNGNYPLWEITKINRVYDSATYADAYIGIYNGRIFTIKVSTGHNSEDGKDTPSAYYDDVISRMVGIGCLTNECKRIDKYTLRWNDGTEVKIVESKAKISGTDIVGSTTNNLPRPKGSYEEDQMCVGIKWANGILSARCQDEVTNLRWATLDYYKTCKPGSTVSNVQGKTKRVEGGWNLTATLTCDNPKAVDGK